MLMRPWLLVGLVLIVPVLIAFLYRSRDRLATVPSIMLFERIAHSRMKNRAFRDLIRRFSFIACLAAVGALVLAAAEPRGNGRGRSIALIVDVSASMGGDNETQLREQVRRVLRQSTGRDQISLISAGREPRHVFGPSRDFSLLDAAVDDLTIERGEADLMTALRLGDALVAGSRRPRVWLVTDGGASAVQRELEIAAPLRVLRVGADRDNVGITVFAARAPADAVDDDEREALVTVVASAGPPRPVTVVLEADGVELDRRTLMIAGGDQEELSFRVRVAAERLTARLRPAASPGGGAAFEDGLSSDDVATLSLARHREPIAHLIAAEDDASAWFVDQALRASGAREVVRHTPADAPERLAEGEVAVVVGRAPEHRIDGPTLFLDARSGELPVRVSASLEGEATQLLSIDADHALTRGVDLDGATINAATAVDLGDEDESVVELDGGTVVAIGGAGRQRWVYLGIDPVGSDVVLRVAFPVLIANALAALSGSTNVTVAPTLPARESSLIPSDALADAAVLAESLPLPSSFPFLLALGAGLLLLAEGFAFYRGYAR